MKANGARDPQHTSIVDFMTGGSLPRALDQISHLAGVPLSLHDADGRRVIASDGPERWRLADEPPEPDSTAIPLDLGAMTIGAIHAPADAPPALLAAVNQIAQAAMEFCHQQVELEHRVKELTILFRLTALLARVADVDRVLDIALDSALDVLNLDAGAVVLFEPDADGLAASDREEDLVHKAARHLSKEWLDSSVPLSRDRIFDRLALKGQVVTSMDMRADDRILDRDRVSAEGLRACIHAGLVIAGRPIGVVRLYSRTVRSFTDSEKRLLKSIAQQAALGVEQTRLLEIKQHERQVQRQLNVAADIQRRMMPKTVPVRAGLDLAARSRPSLELGGDFYDIFEIGDRIGIALGDAVGKGIPAALMVAAVRATLRAQPTPDESPAGMLTRVNRAMARDAQPGEFATVFCAIIDPDTRRLECATAGHDPPMLVRRRDGAITVTDLDVSGLVAGVDANETYTGTTVDLEHGDLVIAYTDGVTDTLDFDVRRFTKDALREAVYAIARHEPDATAQRVLQHIFWSLRQHAGLATQADDQTVVVLRIDDRQTSPER